MVLAAREVASPRRVWSHQRLLVKLSGCHRERPTWFAPGKRLRRTEARCDRRALQSKGPAEKRAEEIHTNTLYHVLSACADLSRPGCGKLQFGAIRVKDSQSWWRPALLAILLADGGRHSDRPDEPHDV